VARSNIPPAQSGSIRPLGEPSQIAPLAEWQLEKWQKFLREFRIHLAYRQLDTGYPLPVLECPWCETVIIRLADERGIFYSWAFGEFEAQCIAHLRNRHRDLEARIYG
jgi:hypothetical protein